MTSIPLGLRFLPFFHYPTTVISMSSRLTDCLNILFALEPDGRFQDTRSLT